MPPAHPNPSARVTQPMVFVTGTGTGVGKTYVSRGLSRALAQDGLRVHALKPIETGCDPHPDDALALARACRVPELASAAGFYRARPPLAPHAVALSGGSPCDVDGVVEATRRASAGADVVLVEGAGGLLVPLTATASIADLVRDLGAPVLLVASDALGTLSHALTAYESALARGLTVLAVVLVSRSRVTGDDVSPATNATVLRERLPVPVLRFPPCVVEGGDRASSTDAGAPLGPGAEPPSALDLGPELVPELDDVLAAAARSAGLVSLLPDLSGRQRAP